ncbi:MAG: LON peptidase substrate-binding domain-containing protein, partial [Pyrinomonadaceae bacterium]
MSESLDKVRDIRELPLFPLSIVLFPSVPLPLHIFEPRYRQMIKDVRETNGIFGISYFDPSIASLDIPSAGHVGCAAEITEFQPLPEGRYNILTVGLIRYRVESYADREDPYLIGRVSFFEDEEDSSEALFTLAREAGAIFTRI